MSKYDKLGAYLKSRGTAFVPMTFAEIERVLGFKLPASQKHPAWWSNSTSNNVMTQVWLDAGYRTEQIDVIGKKLVFRRTADAPTDTSPRAASGLSESASEYREAPQSPREFAEKNGMLRPRRHPAFGALKGTFWIDPNWDLTKPSMDEEELAEWEASLDRKADMIEAGLRRKP